MEMKTVHSAIHPHSYHLHNIVYHLLISDDNKCKCSRSLVEPNGGTIDQSEINRQEQEGRFLCSYINKQMERVEGRYKSTYRTYCKPV